MGVVVTVVGTTTDVGKGLDLDPEVKLVIMADDALGLEKVPIQDLVKYPTDPKDQTQDLAIKVAHQLMVEEVVVEDILDLSQGHVQGVEFHQLMAEDPIDQDPTLDLVQRVVHHLINPSQDHTQKRELLLMVESLKDQYPNLDHALKVDPHLIDPGLGHVLKEERQLMVEEESQIDLNLGHVPRVFRKLMVEESKPIFNQI